MFVYLVLSVILAVANGHSKVFFEREYDDTQQYQDVGMDQFIQDDLDCHEVEKVIYKDQCIPYFEKTCYVHQEADCEKVYDKDCHAEIEEYEDDECFDVTEEKCELLESIDYHVVQEEHNVLRCSQTHEEVCDKVYEMDVITEKDKQCVDVESVDCYDKEFTVTDQKCIYSVEFKYANDGKECDMIPTKECFDKPRTVTERVCKEKKREKCEKFLNEYASPEAEEKCRKVPIKECTLEKVLRPKKAKEYDYHKECKDVKREICKKVERKQLETKCRQLPRKVCKFEPKEQCDIQKQEHCFKEEVVVYEKVCLPGNTLY